MQHMTNRMAGNKGEWSELYTFLKLLSQGRVYAANEKQICPNMKKITLEKVATALENMEHEVKLSEDVIDKANAPLKRMLEY